MNSSLVGGAIATEVNEALEGQAPAVDDCQPTEEGTALRKEARTNADNNKSADFVMAWCQQIGGESRWGEKVWLYLHRGGGVLAANAARAPAPTP